MRCILYGHVPKTFPVARKDQSRTEVTMCIECGTMLDGTLEVPPAPEGFVSHDFGEPDLLGENA